MQTELLDACSIINTTCGHLITIPPKRRRSPFITCTAPLWPMFIFSRKTAIIRRLLNKYHACRVPGIRFGGIYVRRNWVFIANLTFAMKTYTVPWCYYSIVINIVSGVFPSYVQYLNKLIILRLFSLNQFPPLHGYRINRGVKVCL